MITTHSDLGCKRFARMIMGKKPEELCKMFDIPDEWTHQEVGISKHWHLYV